MSGEDRQALGGFSVLSAVLFEIVLASEKFQVLCTTASQKLCVFIFIRDGCHQEEAGDCW